MNIIEDYVSFETAKLLKDKGFDEPCWFWYNPIGEFRRHYSEPAKSSPCYEIACPTLQMAIKWLREVHKVHIIAEPCFKEGTEAELDFNRWFYTIFTECGEYKPIIKIDEFPTYEQACEAAIKYCLENLI